MSTAETALAVVRNTTIVPANITQAMELAKLMSEGGLVPAHLRGKPADCLMVIEQSIRWGMSPFAVAQCTSVIQGKLMYEGKLVTAVVNSRGELAERLRFDYESEGEDRTCRVYGRLKGEDDYREIFVTLGLVRSRNEMWNKQPDQQLAYYGARVWARRHMPEVMLGVYSPDEPIDEVPEQTPEQKAWASYTGPKAPTSSPSASDAGSGAPAVESTATSAEPQQDAASDSMTTAKAAATKVFLEGREPGSDDDEAPTNPHDPKPGEFRDLVECWTWKGAKSNKQWGQGDGEWVSIGTEPQRSLEQNAAIHALKTERGYDDATWRTKLSTRFNKTSSADLSVREASALIDVMKRSTEQHGTADQKKAKQAQRSRRMVEEVANELGARGIGPQDVE